MCGRDLRLPIWKALIGLDVAQCDDQQACHARFRTKRAARVPAAVPTRLEAEHHGASHPLLHRTSA